MSWPIQGYVGTDIGVFYTPNFGVGGQPTWSALNTGLADTNIRTLDADPFAPAARQYVCADGVIYRREAAGTGEWEVILSVADARTLSGDAGITPSWVSCDTLIPGVVWALAYNPYYYFRSTDYGDTWASVGLIPDTGAHGWTPGCIAGHGNFVVAFCNGSILSTRVCVSATAGATWTTYDSGSVQTVDEKWAIGPLVGTKAYGQGLGGSWSIVTAEAGGVTPTGQVVDVTWTGPYGSFWFSPTDPLHIRWVGGDSMVYTHDDWDTSDTSSYGGGGNTTCIAPVVDPSDDTKIIVGRVAGRPAICAVEGEDSTTLIPLAGTNWNSSPYTDAIPETVTVTAIRMIPIQASSGPAVPPEGGSIIRPDTDEEVTLVGGGGQIEAVSMPGHTGVNRGVHIPSDAAGFDVANQPEEHASDLHEKSYLVHMDPDASEGEAMVMGSDGEYVATDIATQDELDTHEGTPDAHHDPVTLGAGNDPDILSLVGQEVEGHLKGHGHTAAAGDGGQIELSAQKSTGAAANQVATADGADGVSWQTPQAVGEYRQFVYAPDGLGSFSFVTNGDGMPVFALLELE